MGSRRGSGSGNCRSNNIASAGRFGDSEWKIALAIISDICGGVRRSSVDMRRGRLAMDKNVGSARQMDSGCSLGNRDVSGIGVATCPVRGVHARR